MSTDSESSSATRTITATEFKAKCLKLMDEVSESGEEIVITKNGKPVAKLTAYSKRKEITARKKPESMYGVDRGKLQILGDIVSPMPPEWFAVPDEYAGADPLIAPIPPDWSLEPGDATEGLS